MSIYRAVFDKQGIRITTYVEGIHNNIPLDAIAITEEEQKLYATNEYIRDADGKPQKKPLHVATLEERLAHLDAQYQPNFAELSHALSMATLAGNIFLINSIKTDYVILKTEYNVKRGEIDG